MESSHTFRVFQAETGRPYELNIRNTESVERLKELLAQASGIPPDQQILLNLTGLMLETSQPISVYERDHVFLFYRKTFTTEINPEPKQPAKLEVPARERIETPERLSTSSRIGSYALEFYRQTKLAEAIVRTADSRQIACERAKSEHQVQLSAIEAATNNLQTHEGNIQQKLSSYLTKYRKAKSKHDEILSAFDNDVQQLKRIKLHNTLLSESKTSLYDCIPERQLRQWGNKLEKETEKLETKTSELEHFCKRLRQQIQKSNLLRPTGEFSKLETRLQRILELRKAQYEAYASIERDLKRTEELLSQPNFENFASLDELNEEHEQNLRLMSSFDQQMYEIIQECYDSNLNLSKRLFKHLRDISSFQSHIRKIGRRIAMYSEVMKKHNENFHHLDLVHKLPETYVHCLQEVVRRRGYRRKFIAETRRLADRLGKMREDEVLKREEFTRRYGSLIPQNLIPGLDEKPPAYSFCAPSFDSSLPEIDSLQDIEDGTFKFLQQIVPGLGDTESAEEDDNDLLMQINDIFYRESSDSFSDSATENAEAENLNAKLAEVRKQYESTQQRIQQLEQELSEKEQMAETVKTVTSENQILTSQLEDLNQQLQSSSGSFSASNLTSSDFELLKERYTKMRDEFKKNKRMLQSTKENLKHYQELYEDSIEEITKIASLDSELKSTKEHLETALANEKKLETELQLLKQKQEEETNEKDTQSSASKDLDSEISHEMKQQLQSKEEEISRMASEKMTQLNELKETINKHQTRIEELEQSEKRLKELVSIKEQQRAEISQNCAHSEKSLKNLSHHLQTVERNFDIVLGVLLNFTNKRMPQSSVHNLLKQVQESKSTSLPTKIAIQDLEPLQDFMNQLVLLAKSEVPLCVEDLQKGKLVLCVFDPENEFWEVFNTDTSQEYVVSNSSALKHSQSKGYAFADVSWVGTSMSMSKSASSSSGSSLNRTEVGVDLHQW